MSSSTALLISMILFIISAVTIYAMMQGYIRPNIIILKVAFIAVIGSFFAFIILGAFISADGNKGNKNKFECRVCHKEFQSDSENAKSIRKTNMCTRCYKNYKNASDYLKELPIN